MKAVRLHRQGDPEQLVYEDAPDPELGAGDALIRVHATGITPTELTWEETYRNCDGSERLPAIPGHEVSGVVESVADGVSDVSIGDEVYALTSFCRDGAAAEYVAVHAADLASKPTTVDHAQAAAVPLSALTVWQAFFDHARLAPGQRVLIHGAAGGVGGFAVQIARWHGAYVIGTASSENRDFLLRLGANEVIDYRQAQFEQAVRDVDCSSGHHRRRNARTLLAGVKADRNPRQFAGADPRERRGGAWQARRQARSVFHRPPRSRTAWQNRGVDRFRRNPPGDRGNNPAGEGPTGI
jgi:NADPH:quinone reductase-like Zn-dependent oxidoreductase